MPYPGLSVSRKDALTVRKCHERFVGRDLKLHFPSGLRTSKPVLSLNEQSQVADHQSWDDASAQFAWPHMIYTFAITGNIASSRDRGREFWTRIAAPCQPRFPPSTDQPVAYKRQSKKGNSQSVKILSDPRAPHHLDGSPYPRQTSSSPLQMD